LSRMVRIRRFDRKSVREDLSSKLKGRSLLPSLNGEIARLTNEANALTE
jgi:hypothetical protein